MKEQFSLLTLAAALMLAASTAQAQSGTLITPAQAIGYRAPGVNGDPNQFMVGGTIAEFIEFRNIDSVLGLGDLGKAENRGWIASIDPAVPGNAGVLSGETAPGNPKFVTQDTDNGIAGADLNSNAYITVQSTYPTDLTNTASNGDVYTLPTRYRIAVRGRQYQLGSAAPVSNGSVTTSPATTFTYSAYQTAVVTGPTNTSQVTFGPGYNSGYKIMSEVQRDGLNNYRGAYAATIDLKYFKF